MTLAPTETAAPEEAGPEQAGLDPAALSRLDASIQADIDAGNHFGASIIVARRGVIGHRKALGVVAPGRTARIDDVYLMMSLSKSFTAALVLRAIDQGRFTLDTRAADLFPAMAGGGKQRVTIRQLLTHTAGTIGGVLPPPPVPPTEIGDLAKNAAAFAAQPAVFTPGSRVSYTGASAYAILGQILVLTDPAQRAFRDIVKEDLFGPLGMTDARFGLATDDPRRVPVSYTEKMTTPQGLQVAGLINNAFNETAEVPAGSSFGTALDAFRFAETIRRGGTGNGHRLLSPALVAYAGQNHTGDMSNMAWDFGREAAGLPDFPAMFSLLGGYARGEGHFLTAAGLTASSQALCAVGGGSTMWMVDPKRDLTFIFLSAGFVDGLPHMQRLSRLSDLALAACVD